MNGINELKLINDLLLRLLNEFDSQGGIYKDNPLVDELRDIVDENFDGDIED